MRVSFGDPRRWVFLAGGLCCLILALGTVLAFGGKFGADTRPVRAAAELPEFLDAAAPNEPQSAATPPSSVWVVYVTGAVMSPGVYEVPENSRVDGAVKRAGGFSIHADPEGINLAARLTDGAHIRVPAMGEADQRPAIRAPAAITAPSDSETGIAPPQSGKININACAEEALLALPGIGPVLARSIIDHREKNGPFGEIEEIQNVSGIGAKRFEAIRAYIAIADF